MKNFSSLCLFFFFFSLTLVTVNSFDPFDPEGNITVTWDITSWTGDGYAAIVTVHNFQKYRHIQAPGWMLGWSWRSGEVIWDIVGGETTDQGDCSSFRGSVIPHSCTRRPYVVDLLPQAANTERIANCCRGGVLTSMLQDPGTAISAFKIVVGQAGTSKTTVRMPTNFSLETPGYTCGPGVLVKPSAFLSPDTRRLTRAFRTMSVTCTYSQLKGDSIPKCCVSLSAFYSRRIVGCPESHMFPVRVHWHIKTNYKEYWRVKIAITNFNQNVNYTDWNLVVAHPNFANVTQSFSFMYKPLETSFQNDSGMFWGVKYYNDLLLAAGHVESEILFRKVESEFTLAEGWAFPRLVYFDGHYCVMPQPDDYPHLPNTATATSQFYKNNLVSLLIVVAFAILV